MKCTKARELLSDQHNGELSPRAEKGLVQHLRECVACQAAEQEHSEMMDLVARVDSPPLPQDFGAVLHQRLVEEDVRVPVRDERTWRNPWPLWLRAIRSVALVLSGAAVVLLFLWLRPAPVPQKATDSAVGSRSVQPRPVAKGMAATKPAPIATPTQRLRLGQVVVLVLSIKADKLRRNAKLQVLLPDGLVLLGEGHQELEEKLMTWSADLVSGENVIRIPVRARRSGEWRLVARARAEGFQSQTETRLVVSKT